MARHDPRVDAALTRWLEGGLLGEEKVEALRGEAAAHHARLVRSRGRLLISVVGAVAALGAVVLFATETWPELSEAGRTFLLAAGALAAYALGLAVQRRPRWRVAGELLRVTGLAAGLFAVVYSSNAWELGTLPARLWGLAALAAAGGAAVVTWRAPTLAAVGHVVFVLPYLASSLVHAADLEFEPVVWILDGVWAAGLVALAVGLRGEGAEERRRRLLPVFVTGAWIGFVLLFFTGAGVLDLEDHAVWPLDGWMLTMALVTAWAARRAPNEAEQTILERHLAACIPAATGLAVFSVAETLEWPGEAWLVAGGLVASAGLAWGMRARNTPGLAASAASLVVVIWIYSVERAEMAFAAAALAVTAALFFWVGSRIREG